MANLREVELHGSPNHLDRRGAQGRNGWFKPVQFASWTHPYKNASEKPESEWEKGTAVTLDVHSTAGIPITFTVSVDDARAIAFGILDSIGEGPLNHFSEEDVACAYAESICPDCSDGTCDLVADEHDLTVYWSLEEDVRKRLRDAADHSLMHNEQANEAIHDSIRITVENLVLEVQDA